MLSRPRFCVFTRPAPSRTRRCFVIACRATLPPGVGRGSDDAPRERRETKRSRVSSPSAAKRSCALAVLRNPLLQEGDDHGPTRLVARERFRATLGGELV